MLEPISMVRILKIFEAIDRGMLCKSSRTACFITQMMFRVLSKAIELALSLTKGQSSEEKSIPQDRKVNPDFQQLAHYRLTLKNTVLGLTSIVTIRFLSIILLRLLHALWYIRVWYIRASTGFLKKIRVCQYPIANICKGIFQSQYSHF